MQFSATIMPPLGNPEYSTRSLHLYLLAATKLGQGNVFTGICDSVHSGGVSASGADTPREQTPPGTKYTPQGLSTPSD